MGPTVAYGVGQVRSGAIMAAQNHTVIGDFLEAFPFWRVPRVGLTPYN